MIEFVFMLTHHDRTVPDTLNVYQQVRATGLRYIGFKDVGASDEDLATITRAAHEDGLQVMLEVVSTSAQEELRSLEAAPDMGVDWVLGGTHPQEGVTTLRDTEIRYCPFPGQVRDHPSVLLGGIDEIADHAGALTEMPGVYGLDLLAYRHVSVDPVALTRAVVTASSGPVIVAGSIDSSAQIHAVAAAGAWGFTIGGAIFEGLLPGTRARVTPDLAAQVRQVLSICQQIDESGAG